MTSVIGAPQWFIDWQRVFSDQRSAVDVAGGGMLRLRSASDSGNGKLTMISEDPYVAIEVPPGSPQIAFVTDCDQWVPRGEVLRCLIDDAGPDGEVVIHIDNRELSLFEFDRLLRTFSGWGMRICFVPADEVHRKPRIEVCEPPAEPGS
jgi:hypothetical protein